MVAGFVCPAAPPYDCLASARRCASVSAPRMPAGRVQMVKSRAAGLVLLLVLVMVAGSARAQVESREGIALQNQILELRRQMQTLQDQGARGSGSPAYPSRAPTPYSPSAGGSGDLVAQLL